MRMVDLIIKKRNGEALSKEEIHYMIKAYVAGEIPDYQMSAYLMAVYYQGMEDQELLEFTDAMLHSGEVVDLSGITGIKCDKHSTGGVGDKTTLSVAPICAACGVKLAKMSGRGLGHTGGTLDKLESIPGLTVSLTTEEFFKQVNEIGLSVIGQTANITPADKLLYALRDVTGTIDSIPLISSSIMSKKLASGAENIVLDVKVGKGAFMKDVKIATKLAETMVKIGKLAGRNMTATLTDMNEPLGCAVGNSLEVIEAINTLKGCGPKDFTLLTKALSAEILLVTGMVKTEEEAYQKVDEVINNGAALNKLRELIKYQHGDERVIDDYSLFKQAKSQIEITFEGNEDVYVSEIDALKIGQAGMLLGAGRETLTDIIDPSVGIVLNKKVGDLVKPGDVIATIYANDKGRDEAIDFVNEAYVVSNKKVDPINKIIKVVR